MYVGDVMRAITEFLQKCLHHTLLLSHKVMQGYIHHKDILQMVTLRKRALRQQELNNHQRYVWHIMITG